MDFYREAFHKARGTAEKICLLRKNAFLNKVPAGTLALGQAAFSPRVQTWVRVQGYRAGETEADTRRSVQNAASGWLRSSGPGGSVFLLDQVGGELSVLYSCPGESEARAVFDAAVPDAALSAVAWDGHPCKHLGVLIGTLSAEQLSESVAALRDTDCYVACVSVPVSDEEVWEKLRENEAMINALTPYKSFQRTYGNATRRVEELPVPEVEEAIRVLREETQFLTRQAGTGFVRSYVRFGADSGEGFRRLSTVLRSCMRSRADADGNCEPVRMLEVQGEARNAWDCLSAPRVQIRDQFTADLVSWQRIPDAAEFCTMPVNACRGFYVKNYRTDYNSSNIFPVVSPVTEAGLSVGNMLGSDARAVIPLSAMYAHLFITGASRTGKTTTAMKIIKLLHDRGIPALVIEAAKKEYIRLLPQIPGLRIYTAGADGWPLRFNPLQAEDGTLIENHVDAVVRAITAATGGEHPIPEALEGLLKMTYEKAGWTYGTMAYTDPQKPFPTFRDAFGNIPEYIHQHARYGPEVRQNLEGALTLRTTNLYTGALGKIFGDPFGLTAKELLECPTVIELADFSETGVEFLMNMLLFKLHAYVSRLPESSTLKRVIVVEEAHNVFRKTESEDSGRARNNQYFEKMLAEVGASGTGMILCDQRPSIMSDAVLANTAVKITHALNEPQDSARMAASMGLSDAQEKKMQEFTKGVCLIRTRGLFGVQYTRIEALPAAEQQNPACHICPSRFRCRKADVKRLLESMDTAKVQYHLSKVLSDPYHSSLVEKNISSMLQDLHISAAGTTRCCLLGELLTRYGNSSFQEQRVIVNTYDQYLRGGRKNE